MATVDQQLLDDAQMLHVVEDDEIEDYEEDNESDDDGKLLLGFAEDPDHKWRVSRQYFPTKAGGAPAWLDPVDIPTGRSSLCDFCGVPLQFLLQVYGYVPDKESAFHRTVFVFVCTSLSCMIQHQRAQQNCDQKMTSRSVKVFRCQLPRSNPFYSYDSPDEDGTTEPLGVGAVLCDWCGSWKADRECSGCKIAHYCSDIHRLLGHKSECCQTISSEDSGSANNKAVHTDGEKAPAGKLLWREMEIYPDAENRSKSDKDSSQNNIDIDSYVPADGLDDDSTKAFMDALEGDDEDSKSWGTFQARIRKASEQVLRYWLNWSPKAKPLWPMATGRPSESDIPKCNHCGGELSFEFQIMPQLLINLGVKNDADSVDWGTIAVYTCQASCDGGPSYKDEFAWVQPTPPKTTKSFISEWFSSFN